MGDGVQDIGFRRVSVEVKFVFDRSGECDETDEGIVGSDLELGSEVFDEAELFVEVIVPFAARGVHNEYDVGGFERTCYSK